MRRLRLVLVVALAGSCASADTEQDALTAVVSTTEKPPAVTVPTPAPAELRTARYVSVAVKGDHPLGGTAVFLGVDGSHLDVVADCNRITIEYRVSDDILIADRSEITEYFCGPLADGKDRWLRAFMTGGPAASWFDEQVALSNATTSITFVRLTTPTSIVDPAEASTPVVLPPIRYVSVAIEGEHPLSDTPLRMRRFGHRLEIEAACNVITVWSYTYRGTQFVNDIDMTDQDCDPGPDEQDRWLLEFFSGALTATATDDQLTLSNESNSITFDHVMESEGAPDSPPPVVAPPPVTLPNARFVSARIEGDHPLADTPVQLRFEGFLLDVTAACNNITIVYRVDDTVLKAEESSITAADCGSPRHEQDHWIEAFMSSWPTISTDDDELTLSNATNSITFVKPI